MSMREQVVVEGSAPRSHQRMTSVLSECKSGHEIIIEVPIEIEKEVFVDRIVEKIVEK